MKRSTFAQSLAAISLAFAFGGPALADPPNVPPNDYLNALRTADMFALAWARRDPAGAATLSPALKQKLGASSVTQFFEGTSSPQNWAVEVLTGKKIGAGSYRFPIRLYSYLSAGGGLVQPAAPGYLIVEKFPGGWYVATLPQ
jgi:hypothetical protein